MYNFGAYEDSSHVVQNIIVGEGAPLVQPVTEWLSSYHRTPSHFVSAVISTLKRIDPQVKNYFSLVSQSGISGEFFHDPLFKTNLRQISEKSKVELDDRASLKLFGQERESYGRMLNLLFAFLKPVILAGIPTDTKLRSDLRAAVATQLGMRLDKPLDDS
jgi:hypothetical protein